jgi:hypothetical protein
LGVRVNLIFEGCLYEKTDMAVSCQEKKVPRPSGFEG